MHLEQSLPKAPTTGFTITDNKDSGDEMYSPSFCISHEGHKICIYMIWTLMEMEMVKADLQHMLTYIHNYDVMLPVFWQKPGGF